MSKKNLLKVTKRCKVVAEFSKRVQDEHDDRVWNTYYNLYKVS